MFAPGGFDPRRTSRESSSIAGNAYVNPQPDFSSASMQAGAEGFLRNQVHGRIAFANTDLGRGERSSEFDSRGGSRGEAVTPALRANRPITASQAGNSR